jgi:hypothetical protein
MRRIVVSNIVSLDGFFESSDKKLDWFAPDEEFFNRQGKCCGPQTLFCSDAPRISIWPGIGRPRLGMKSPTK